MSKVWPVDQIMPCRIRCRDKCYRTGTWGSLTPEDPELSPGGSYCPRLRHQTPLPAPAPSHSPSCGWSLLIFLNDGVATHSQTTWCASRSTLHSGTNLEPVYIVNTIRIARSQARCNRSRIACSSAEIKAWSIVP